MEIVAPGDFIAIAEEMGLIEHIGEWALRKGCAQSAAWLEAGLRPIKMAVNLSAKQLQSGHFIQIVERALGRGDDDKNEDEADGQGYLRSHSGLLSVQ